MLRWLVIAAMVVPTLVAAQCPPASAPAAVRPSGTTVCQTVANQLSVSLAQPVAASVPASGARAAPEGKPEAKPDPTIARLTPWILGTGLVTTGLLVLAGLLLLWRSHQLAGGTDGLRVRSHWGGLGGESGGWSMSPAGVALVGAALCLGTAALVLGQMLEMVQAHASKTSEPPSGIAKS